LTQHALDGTTARDAPVAQLDRAAAFEAAGRRFDSCQARHSSRTMRRMPILLAALLTAAPAAEITALLDDFLAHVDDAAMHERFWADDLVYVSAAGAVKTKKIILDSMRAGDTPGTRGHAQDEPKSTFSAEEVKVRALARDVAVLNFRLVQQEGKEVNHFRNSGTFVRRNRRWQAVSWQATRESKPAP
jgi:hypothetical protein